MSKASSLGFSLLMKTSVVIMMTSLVLLASESSYRASKEFGEPTTK
jgi:hypothetical protein